MRRDQLRLKDILEHIDSALLAVTGKVRSDFESNPRLQKAVQYDLMIIGEAASNISGELRTKYSEVPWKDVRGLRNIVAHEYFSVDLKIVWHTAVNDLPLLRAQIEQILQTEFPGGAAGS